MRRVFQSVLRLLVSRFARNIYLWLLLGYIVFNNTTEEYRYPPAVYHRLIPAALLILAVYTYVNNLLLVPRYLATGRYKRYVVLDAALTLFIALVHVLFFKVVKTSYPLIEIYHLTLITSPVGTDWQFLRILEEVLWYAGGLLFWQLLLLMAWYANQYYRKVREAELYRQKQMEAELALLKNQVNPHFLFNTLNNIYGLALRKTDEAPEAIMRLSSFMRYMLYEGSKERVSALTEKDAMEAYIELELLRLSDRSRLSFSIEVDRAYQMPGLIWLPILENVFKHGTRMISEEMFIDYRFSIREGLLRIDSQNYYKPAAGGGSGEGTGLNNLRKRLELLYGEKYTLNIVVEEDVFSVQLELQLT